MPELGLYYIQPWLTLFLCITTDAQWLLPPLFHTVPPDWSHQTHLWPKKDVFDLIGPLMCPLMPLDGPLWPTKLLQSTTPVAPWLVPSPLFQTVSPYCSHKTCLWPIKVIFGGPLIVQPAWLWYSQSRVALGMEKYRRFDFHPENVNIWPTTGQNRWWYMLRSSLVFTCFNFIHYWGQGGPFSPGDLSISSQMSWGTTMWIWVDQSQRSMFVKAENYSYVSSAMICRSKTSIVHNCIIFFCSLDVRNIVQGGDPLYAVVNHKEGCGGHSLPKWVRFLQKTPAYSVEAWNFFFWDSKISYFGHRGVFFPTFSPLQNLLSLCEIYWVH